MTKIDVFSGFLGAGKTTLIKKLIAEAYKGEKLVLIENEFGEISVDGGFMQDTGVTVNELISGCICCSLAGDFKRAMRQVVDTYHPDRILIEPSGVGLLSDILTAVTGVEGTEINCAVTVADANRCKTYMKVLGEFFDDQVQYAGAVVLSRTQKVSPEKVEEAVGLLRTLNPDAVIITTPWDELDGEQILAAIEHTDTLEKEVAALKAAAADEDDDDDDEECDDPECECHHHHDDDDDGDGHEHHHHHHHHHHHDADEVFVSWGVETAKKFTEEELRHILDELEEFDKYGTVLRAKGIVDSADGGEWLHFDYVPGEANVRRGGATVTGRVVVIGSGLKQEAVQELFGL